MMIANNGIGTEGAKCIADYLGKSASLRRLKLGSNNIGDDGCKPLAEGIANQPVELLDLGEVFLVSSLLECNKIEAEGVKLLANAMKASADKVASISLNLAWDCIGDEGTQAISELISTGKVGKLNLESAGMGLEGTTQLAKAISCTPDVQVRIHSLNVSGNKLGDLGVQVLSQAIPFVGKLYLGLREGSLWLV